MTPLAEIYLPGALTLWCALAFALAALWGYATLARGDETARAFGRRAYGFFALSILLGAAVLALALARRDFRIDYVSQYSGLELAPHFQLAAFWAGQKGSFLIWLVWGALLGVPLARTTGRLEAPVMGLYTLTQLGILLILVRESPFLMLTEAPLDGKGLNPLLQDNWMVIHPPIMFIGYALTAIPFCFAMAALLKKDTSEWAARAFPWALAAFLVLGTAILMGGYWAYKTLGWGGYWGWDPVENASLIPWLLTTALVHGLYLERSKRRYRRANLVLASLAYLAVLYGTFLTRSGVLADFSVHSFVDLGISGWLVALMAFFAGLAALLFATRLRIVETEPNEDPPFSRGTLLVLATIAILTSALVVTIGTSAPLLTRFLENPGQVGPEFYNRVNQPLAILVAFLLAIVPFLTWRGETSLAALLRKIAPAGAVALAGTVVAAVLAIRDPLHLLFVFLALAALSANFWKVVTLFRDGSGRRAGGYLAHVGVGVMLIGFLSSSAYDESAKLTLVQGVPVEVRNMTLTFRGFSPAVDGSGRDRMAVEVARGGDSFTAYPKMFLNPRTRQLMVNPHVESFASGDLYFSPLEFDPGESAGSVREVELPKGGEQRFGDLVLRFVDFDLNKQGNALAAMQSGGKATIAARLMVTRGENAEPTLLEPVYIFDAAGQVEFPALPLPGGGQVAVAGINASTGSVRLLLDGVGLAAGAKPPELSLDVTEKPLIGLVWYGLYVVLAGGLLAYFERLRASRRADALPPATA
jgi:cytochrome c-type biogenesis protein CcmF